MKESQTTNDKHLERATVVSFDIPSKESNKRNIVQNFLHGREETKNVNGKRKTYTYPGLLEEGGMRMGQSVLLLPPDLASRFIRKLSDLKIDHRSWNVLVCD